MSSNIREFTSKLLTQYCKFVPQTSKPVICFLAQTAVQYVECKVKSQDLLNVALTKLSYSGCQTSENIYELFTVIMRIVTLFFREFEGNVDISELHKYLLLSKFAEPSITDLVAGFQMQKGLLRKSFNKISSFNSQSTRIVWRVNIAASNRSSNFNGAPQPSIILQFHSAKGVELILELPLGVFHYIRFSVAALLTNCLYVKSRHIVSQQSV